MWNDVFLPPTRDRFESEGLFLKELICQSGSVALIKSLQVLSQRQDLFKKILRKTELNDVRVAVWNSVIATVVDSVPNTFTKDDMLKIVAKEWNVDANAIKEVVLFDNDMDAVSGASIGQVYKGKLRSGKQLRNLFGEDQESYDYWSGRTVSVFVCFYRFYP